MNAEPKHSAEPHISLDDIGISYGTDKTSLANDYLRHYEEIFDAYRNKEITLWEIGVAQGASLKSWNEYFPKARIVGIDNNPQCKRHESERITVAIGSQDDPEFLAGLSRSMVPDIIIDDGSHRADHIQFTFDRLFPVLAPGGLYVIEDLWLHSGESAVRMRGRATTGMPEFISAITSRLLVGRIEPDDDGGLPGYLFRTIDRVQVISGAVVIAKKGAAAETPLWDRVIPVIEASNQPESWYHLSSYIMQKRGPLDIAVAAMRKAVAREPNNAGYRMRLADCLDRTGFLEEAISHAEAAVRLAGDSGAAGPYPKFLDALIRKSQRDRA